MADLADLAKGDRVALPPIAGSTRGRIVNFRLVGEETRVVVETDADAILHFAAAEIEKVEGEQ